MAISIGDRVVRMRAADGGAAVQVMAARETGDRFVLFNTADGVRVPIRVDAMNTTGERGFLAITADDVVVPVRFDVDVIGFLFTGGAVSGGVTTRAYDPNGVQVWSANHGAAVLCIAADSDGMAFTGGGAAGDGNTVRAYNPDGSLAWSLATSTAVQGIDCDDDYVYVADATTAEKIKKYDKSGSFIWDATPPSGVNPNCIAVDGSGNTFTGGITKNSKNIITFDSSGTVVLNFTDGTFGVLDVFAELSGVFYAGGYSQALKKYSAAGVLQWTKAHGGQVQGVAGNGTYVCIGGQSGTGSFTTRRYTVAGTLSWSKDNGATVECIAMDANDSVYTGGLRAVSDTMTTRAYGTSGNLAWSVDHGDTVSGIAVRRGA